MINFLKNNRVLLLILLLSVAFNSVGIKWGLPDRFNPDEVVADSLRMAAHHQLYNSSDFYHPTFYYFVLAGLLGIFILILKVIGYPLLAVYNAASISWFSLTKVDPGFATNIYMIARFLSAIFGAATVLMVYLITKRLFDKKAALFSAIILTFTAGFTTYCHYAKGTALVVLLDMMVLYMCIVAVDTLRKKYLYLASFFAGLALATKYDAGILLLPLAITFISFYMKKNEIGIIAGIKKSFLDRSSYIGILLYIAAIMIGWPAIFFKFANYVDAANYYKVYFEGVSIYKIPYIVGMLNYFIQLVVIFGFALGIFVIIGNIFYFIRLRTDKRLIIFSFISAYFLIASSYVHSHHAYTKYIIAIVPPLCIMAGVCMRDFIYKLRLNVIFKFAILTAIIIVSLSFIMHMNLMFLGNDTRYKTTEWIEKNIPKTATIEIFNVPEFIFSGRIARDYDVWFYGGSSKKIESESLFKRVTEQELARSHMEGLLKNRPKSDYIVLVFEHISDIPYEANNIEDNSVKGRLEYDLVNGKNGYLVVKEFISPNSKVISNVIRGFSHAGNIFTPSNLSVYTSPVIVILKRNS